MSEPTLYVPSLIEQLQACAADRRNLEEARAVMQAVIAKLRALRAELETCRQERDTAREIIIGLEMDLIAAESRLRVLP